MTTQQYFLAFSNARCGSTLLQTSLARLPGIATDFEPFWDGPNTLATGVPGYSPIVTSGWDWKHFLGTISTTAPIVGTRVILSGFSYYSPEDVLDLMAGVDPDIAIIHTTRDYFDILKSSRIRDHITWVSDGELDKAAAEDPSLGATSLWKALRQYGLREVHGRKNPGTPTLESSRDFVMLQFINDLVIAEIARRANRSMLIEFESFRYNLHEIAEFVGCNCTKKECDAVIGTPVAKRLPPVPDEELPNWQELKALCQVLNQGIRTALENHIPISEIWDGKKIHLRT